MPDIDHIRGEIERMRVQVGRQRKEILSLQRAGISTASADALLERMLNNIDALCAERDKLRALEPKERRVLGGRSW
jgi:hypothetical protein